MNNTDSSIQNGDQVVVRTLVFNRAGNPYIKETTCYVTMVGNGYMIAGGYFVLSEQCEKVEK